EFPFPVPGSRIDRTHRAVTVSFHRRHDGAEAASSTAAAAAERSWRAAGVALAGLVGDRELVEAAGRVDPGRDVEQLGPRAERGRIEIRSPLDTWIDERTVRAGRHAGRLHCAAF